MHAIPRHCKLTVATALATLLASGLAASTATGAGAVAAKQPDLRVSTLPTPPDTAESGDAFGVATTVTNKGKARAAASTTRFYLSRNATKGGDVQIGAQRLAGLPAGRSARARTRLTIPRSTPAGAYYVITCADDARAVRESNERNNCVASATRVRVSKPFAGTLRGTLSFSDTGSSTDNGTLETWDLSAEVRVRMDISGPLLDETFADDGSSYRAVGVRDTNDTSPYCVDTSHSDYAGAGGFQYSGNPFTDDISGHFGHVTRRELDLGLHFRYDRVTTTKRTGQGEFPCDPYETTEGPITHLDVNVVEFQKVSQTSTTITYEVVAWQASGQGGPSDWDSVEGRLVLAQRP